MVFFFLLLFLVFACTAADDAGTIDEATVTTNPHILLVVIDDMGTNDLGYHGSGIQTNFIDDEPINQGIFLNNSYVLPFQTYEIK